MGASTGKLVLLLSRDFLKLLAIACIIAIPSVYILFDHLLASIQRYNVRIGWIEIFGSLVLVVLLGLTTIFSQTLKAANANPAENLRNE